MVWKTIVALIFSYFLGSIPWGYVVGKKLCKINIMEHGSGNIGATNTFRILGPKMGSLVFLLDLGKGFVAAMVGGLVGGVTLSVFTGLVAIFGHTFSVFLHFKGGKGVATGAGAAFWWCPPAIACALAIWVILTLITGYVSVASIIACICCCLFMILFHAAPLQIIICAVVVLYIIYKHRSNIRRLLDGNENRVDLIAAFRKKKNK